MEAKIRKWGNSYGLLLSKDALAQDNFIEGELVDVTLKKKNGLSGLFGICKGKKTDVQAFKDEIHEQERKDDEILLRQLRNHRRDRRKNSV
jgi:antitoxin component of MazEF toxin-antitoxin module